MPHPLALACLTLTALCVLATPARAAAADPGDSSSGQGLRKRGAYLNLAPGVVGFSLVAAVPPFYVWGLDAGYHLPIGRVFAMQLGGFAEHVTHRHANSVRLGAIGRFGGGTERVFGYGLVRVGPDIGIVHNPAPNSPRALGFFNGSFGGGVMGLVHPIVGLGGEAALDLVGGHGGLGYFARLRFFIALKF